MTEETPGRTNLSLGIVRDQRVWQTGALTAIALLLMVVCAPTVASAQPSTTTTTPTLPNKAELERQKLAAEIEKLRHDADAAEGFSGAFSRYAPFVTAMLALGGLLVTVWNQGTTRRRELQQREDESVQRLEDRFATILNELGSTAVPTQAGAASSLVTYLRPEHKRFHHQVRIAVLTNLKVDHDEPIRKLLARVYKESCAAGDPADQFERDLSRAKLGNTDLSALELREADLAFADLHNASLVGCDLYRARGLNVELTGARACTVDDRITSLIEVRFRGAIARDTDFTKARMINAHLKGADLRGARFYGTLLQAAHLEGAKLQEARFQGANVNDTYFYGAEFDHDTIASLLHAYNWRNAHFDWTVRTQLEALAAQT